MHPRCWSDFHQNGGVGLCLSEIDLPTFCEKFKVVLFRRLYHKFIVTLRHHLDGLITDRRCSATHLPKLIRCGINVDTLNHFFPLLSQFLISGFVQNFLHCISIVSGLELCGVAACHHHALDIHGSHPDAGNILLFKQIIDAGDDSHKHTPRLPGIAQINLHPVTQLHLDLFGWKVKGSRLLIVDIIDAEFCNGRLETTGQINLDIRNGITLLPVCQGISINLNHGNRMLELGILFF